MKVTCLRLTAPKFWRRRFGLAILLYPFSLIYGCVVVLRRWYYRWIAQPTALARVLEMAQAKVLVVGNVTVGGTGKTPLVACLAQFFKEHGYKIAVVMRGYRGRADHYPYVVDGSSAPEMAGDEACLLFRETGILVVVDPDRARAVSYLIEQGYKLIISDDGLQHYRLPRQGEIVVFNSEYGLGNGWMLPAGPLRELPRKRLQKADWVVVSESGCGGSNSRMDVLRTKYGSKVHVSRVVPRYFVSIKKPEIKKTIKEWTGARVVAVAAIGNPEKFFKTLETLGFIIETKFCYPDHYAFVEDDLKKWGQGTVIMTSKDAVKILNPTDNLWYLSIDVEITEEFKKQLLAWSNSK